MDAFLRLGFPPFSRKARRPSTEPWAIEVKKSSMLLELHLRAIPCNILFAIHITCHLFFSSSQKTRGPKGPWIAHLRKRSKVTVELFTEDH